MQYGSQKEADEAPHRMMVTVTCGTAKLLGYTWEPQKDGSVHVKMGDNWHVASSWSEFARWVREDWRERNQ